MVRADRSTFSRLRPKVIYSTISSSCNNIKTERPPCLCGKCLFYGAAQTSQDFRCSSIYSVSEKKNWNSTRFMIK